MKRETRPTRGICPSGKIAYYKKREAKQAAKSSEKYYRDGQWDYYKCVWCHLWHVGHHKPEMWKEDYQ